MPDSNGFHNSPLVKALEKEGFKLVNAQKNFKSGKLKIIAAYNEKVYAFEVSFAS